MKALRQIRHGDAESALQLVNMPVPKPGPGQIVVKMECAALHSSDVLNLSDPARTAHLPHFIGTEGVGRIDAVGDGVAGFKVGQRVFPPKRSGVFSEYIVCAATDAYHAPEQCSAEALCIVQTMGLTAHLLLDEFARMPAGSWIIQNAANSSVGRIIIALAHHRGLRTVNIVRRDDVEADLKAIGADVVIVDDSDADALAAKTTQEISVGFDMIGGRATSHLAHCLSKNATLVLYGANSGAAAQIDFIDLARNNLTVTGFGLSRAFNKQSREQKAKTISDVAALAANGIITTAIAGRHTLDDYRAAFAQAVQPNAQRNGKVLFTF